MKQRMTLKIVLVIMTLIAMCGIMTGCSGNKKDDEKQSTYKTAIDYRYEGMEKGDIEIYKKAFPEFLIDDIYAENDRLQSTLLSMKFTYGNDVKITFEVSKEKDLTDDDLSIVEKYVKLKYNKIIDVTDGKQVEIKETLKGSIDEDTAKRTFRVYKIDGEWKIISESISSMKTYVQNNK